MKKMLYFLMVSVLLLSAGNAKAGTIVLDFEGITNLDAIEDYYLATYGVDFSDNALALVDADAGGTGNFGGESSPSTVMFFLSGSASTLNFESGFDTGFSFFYAGTEGGYVTIYDNINGTGNPLGTFTLPATPNNGAAADPTGFFGPFAPIGVAFNGIAKSISFGGVINQIAFDDITFGSATAGDRGGSTVPEPGTMLLLGLGLLGYACIGRKQRVS